MHEEQKAARQETGPLRRDDFETPAGRYYLSHSIGLKPREADARLEDGFTAPWRAGDGKSWDSWLAAIEGFRSALAPLIGARAGDICPQTNISSALSKIIFSLPERARRKKIVLTEDDFPTVGYVAAQARRIGYELVFLPGGQRLADIDAWAPAFQDDVQALIATHVFSNSAVKAPVSRICEKARQRGVFCILDIAQSAGALPVELGEWRPDFAIGTAVKYLCGGPGAAFLWTEKETAARCSPLDVGWFSHARPFERDIHNFQYADGALRYWGGTPSVAPFAVARAGFEMLAEVGIERIAAHNQALMSRFVDALPAAAFASHVRRGERGSAAVVAVRDAAAASRALERAGLLHDLRAGGVRVSLHLYNDDDDVEALAVALESLI